MGKTYPWLHLGVCVFCDRLFLATHHFAASLLYENWKQKCKIPHVFSQFGLCGSHACSSGALRWRVCVCREGALDGLDFFHIKTTTKTKQTNGTFLLFMPVANYKADPWGLRFCAFPSRKAAALCGFSPFVARPGTRKKRLKRVKAFVLISYVYVCVLLMWEEDAPLPLFSYLRGSPLGLSHLVTLLCGEIALHLLLHLDVCGSWGQELESRQTAELLLTTQEQVLHSSKSVGALLPPRSWSRGRRLPAHEHQEVGRGGEVCTLLWLPSPLGWGLSPEQW